MFTIIDIETTGLSRYTDKITEIAAVKFRDGKVVKSFQTLVNPEIPISSFITKLTGIDDEMVKDAPTIDKVLPSFLKFLEEDIFVAHNATFDFGFIEHNLKMYHNINLQNNCLCTRKLANRLFPELPHKRLGDLCTFFEINNQQAHRALGDVEATAQVFNKMLKKLQERGFSQVSEIIDFEKSIIKR